MSIITVTYNCAKILEETIKSVITQTYGNIEYIVVDGLSSDGTKDIISRYKSQIGQTLCEPDHGIYDAINKGIKLSSGEIICLLHAGDIYPNNQVIEKVTKEFKKNSDIEVLLTDICFFKKTPKKNILTRKVSASWFRRSRLRFGWMPPHPGIFLRRKVHKKVGLYRTDYEIAADYEFIVRMFTKFNIKFKVCSQISVLMAEGGTSTKNLESTRIISKEIIRSCIENGLYTNKLFVNIRLPIKFLLKILIRP